MKKKIFLLLILAVSSMTYAQKGAGFLLSKWDTLPVSWNFIEYQLAGNNYKAYWNPLGQIKVGNRSFDLTKHKDKNASELLILQDSVLYINDRNLKTYLETINSEMPNKHTVFPVQAFDDLAKYAETKKMGAAYNIVPLRYWLKTDKDTLLKVEMQAVNMDKDPELERILRFQSLHNRELLMVVDPEGSDWLIRNADERTLGAINPPYNVYFDQKIQAMIAQYRIEMEGNNMESGEDGQTGFFLTELIQFYRNHKWSRTVRLQGINGEKMQKIGKYTFVHESSSRYFLKNENELVAIAKARTTGGWLKSPDWQTDTISYTWNDAENRFDERINKDKEREMQEGDEVENSIEQAKNNFWGVVPNETWWDTTGYYLPRSKQKLKATLNYKIIASDNSLQAAIIGGHYFFDGHKWLWHEKEEVSFSRLQNENEGSMRLVPIQNMGLAKVLDSLVEKKDSKQAQYGVISKKSLDSLERGNIPYNLKNELFLNLIDEDYYYLGDFTTNVTVKFFTLSNGYKLVCLFKKGELLLLKITIDTKNNKVLDIAITRAKDMPMLKNDLLIENERIEMEEGSFSGEAVNFGKWTGIDWKTVFTLPSHEIVMADLSESISVQNEMINDEIIAHYHYKWFSNDKKTILFESEPYTFTFKYDKTEQKYIPISNSAKIGLEDTAVDVHDIKKVIFRENYPKIQLLETMGTPEQQKWLALYLPFYAESYGIFSPQKVKKNRKKSKKE